MTYIYCMETITSHVINVTPELNSIIKKSFDFKISRTLTINIEFIHNGYLCSLWLNSKTQLTSIICVQKNLIIFCTGSGLKFFFFYKGYFSETNNRATKHLFTKCPDVKEICDWKLVLNLITWFCRFFKNKPVE